MLVFACGVFFSCKQNYTEYKIPDKLLGDTSIKTSHGNDFVYELEKDSVFEYQGKGYLIKLPSAFKNKNMLWGEVYFTGFEKSKTSLFYLLDSTQKGYSLIIDGNGDLDFSNDKILPISTLDSFHINYSAKKDSVNNFSVLEKIPFKKYSEQTLKFMTAIGILPKHSAKIRYALMETRLNYKQVILPDSNTISIEDYNCNGKYNDRRDKIYAYDVFKETKVSELQVSDVKKGFVFPYKNQNYKLVSIDDYGTSIKLTKTNEQVDLTNYMPNINFKDLQGKEIDYKTLSKEKDFTVLYFWGTWCIGCRMQTDSIVKLFENYKTKINFYSMNNGDKKVAIEKYQLQKHISFPIYSISDKETKLAYVDGYPTFLVINKKGIVENRFDDFILLRKYLNKVLKN